MISTVHPDTEVGGEELMEAESPDPNATSGKT